MKLTSLEAAMNAKPFRPFELRVDGEVILVRHPEALFFAEKKTTLIIDTGARIHIVDVAQISKVSLVRRALDELTAKAS